MANSCMPQARAIRATPTSHIRRFPALTWRYAPSAPKVPPTTAVARTSPVQYAATLCHSCDPTVTAPNGGGVISRITFAPQDNHDPGESDAGRKDDIAVHLRLARRMGGAICTGACSRMVLPCES